MRSERPANEKVCDSPLRYLDGSVVFYFVFSSLLVEAEQGNEEEDKDRDQPSAADDARGPKSRQDDRELRRPREGRAYNEDEARYRRYGGGERNRGQYFDR